MKVIAFNGSPRKDGNTSILIRHVFEELEGAGIATEVVQIGGRKVQGCTACLKCFEKKNMRCVIDSDLVNESIERMLQAEGVLLGSPTYFANVTPEMKALIDRAGIVGMANADLFKHKVGAAVVAVRRAGAGHALDAMNHFFLSLRMIVPGSNYPNLAVGMNEGDVERDEEGIGTMRALGQSMAWLLTRIHR